MTDARPDEGEWNPVIKLSDEKGKYTGDPDTILLAKKVFWGLRITGGSKHDLFVIFKEEEFMIYHYIRLYFCNIKRARYRTFKKTKIFLTLVYTIK